VRQFHEIVADQQAPIQTGPGKHRKIVEGLWEMDATYSNSVSLLFFLGWGMDLSKRDAGSFWEFVNASA
jgi:hypothetical protein